MHKIRLSLLLLVSPHISWGMQPNKKNSNKLRHSTSSLSFAMIKEKLSRKPHRSVSCVEDLKDDQAPGEKTESTPVVKSPTMKKKKEQPPVEVPNFVAVSEALKTDTLDDDMVNAIRKQFPHFDKKK